MARSKAMPEWLIEKMEREAETKRRQREKEEWWQRWRDNPEMGRLVDPLTIYLDGPDV